MQAFLELNEIGEYKHKYIVVRLTVKNTGKQDGILNLKKFPIIVTKLDNIEPLNLDNEAYRINNSLNIKNVWEYVSDDFRVAKNTVTIVKPNSIVSTNYIFSMPDTGIYQITARIEDIKGKSYLVAGEIYEVK